jgi:hypothetical protein
VGNAVHACLTAVPERFMPTPGRSPDLREL